MAQNTRAIETRQALLHAAVDHFQRAGLTGHTLRSLAAALGTSHRMLQYHFGSKEDLIREALEVIRRRVVARAGDATTDDVLSGGLWDALVADTSAASVMYQGLGLALAEPERFGSYASATFDDWYALTTRVLTDRLGQCDPATATLAVAAMRGLFLDLVTIGDAERVRAGFDCLLAVLGLDQ